MTSTPTPARALGAADPAGYRLLRDVGSSYQDGGEAAVLELVRGASDLRSDSVEMVSRARGWAQRYHVDPARASILRCLELPPTARVLEIGAGCGAIARYLGENCAAVDSLEPVPIRAAAAAARCRDLDSVQVLVGELDDIPAEPSYDIAVVIGVLEYVGAGTADTAPYLDFLRGIRSRLAAGGTLVLAIENKLGVKYLVGAPEDHTNRAFDGPEGYPRGGKARTFSRLELQDLLRTAGFATAETRLAFPDYKMPRAVFGELPAAAESLAWRIPRFPSPDWRSPRPKIADERAVWRSLVQAGLAGEFGNSFLVLAGADQPSRLWPEHQAGMFWSTDRIAGLGAQTRIGYRDDGAMRFIRRRLRGSTGGAAGADGTTGGTGGTGGTRGTRLIESDTGYIPGVDVTDHLAAHGISAFAPIVGRWLALLDETMRSAPDTAVDVVPHNLVIDDGGLAQLIDIELAHPMSREAVIRRGLFWLADRLAPLAPADRFADPATGAEPTTVGELMRSLAALVVTEIGELATVLDADGRWIEETVRQEAEFLIAVRPGPDSGPERETWTEQVRARTAARVTRTLRSLPYGTRLPESAKRSADTAKTLRAERDAARADAAATAKKLAATRAEIKRINSSRAVRLVRLPRRILRKIRGR